MIAPDDCSKNTKTRSGETIDVATTKTPQTAAAKIANAGTREPETRANTAGASPRPAISNNIRDVT